MISVTSLVRMGETHVRGLVESDRTGVLGGDLIYFGLIEVEASTIEVLRHDVLARCLGNDSEAALRGPAQQDLGGFLAVLLGDLDD